MIGMDLEWKPEFIDNTKPTPAILQIFSHEEGYIIDLISLNNSEKLNDVLKTLFTNKDLLFLGFDFEGDYKVIKDSNPKLDCFLEIK